MTNESISNEDAADPPSVEDRKCLCQSNGDDTQHVVFLLLGSFRSVSGAESLHSSLDLLLYISSS